MNIFNPAAAILIVEDEILLRSLMLDVLEDFGVRMFAASSADEGYAVLLAHPISLLVTDVITPGKLDGWDLAWLAHNNNPEIAIIITSGFNNHSAEPMPPDAVYLAKPWTIERFLLLVSERI